MLRNTQIRRPIATLLVILGGMMIFFATDAWAGWILLVLGIAIEVIGITLKHKDQQ